MGKGLIGSELFQLATQLNYQKKKKKSSKRGKKGKKKLETLFGRFSTCGFLF